MKKAFSIAIAITLAFALPALAQQARGPGFEERKAEVLKHIDERIARNEQEKACVQAAMSHQDLMACKDKFAPPNRQGGPGGPGGMGMGGPGGQGRPGGLGGPAGQAGSQGQ